MRPARRPASGNCRSAPCRIPTPGRLRPARPHAACQRGAASSLRLLHRSCLAPAAVPCLGPARSAGGSVGRSRPGACLSGRSERAPTRYRPLQPSTSSRHERPMSRGRRPRGARLHDVDLARGRPGAVRKPAGHVRGGAGPRSGGLLPRRRGQHPQRRPDAVAPCALGPVRCAPESGARSSAGARSGVVICVRVHSSTAPCGAVRSVRSACCGTRRGAPCGSWTRASSRSSCCGPAGTKSRRPAVRRRADVKARPESLRSAVSISAPPATRALAGADVYHSSSPLPQPARDAPRRQARRRRWPGPARARSGRARCRARHRVPVLVRQLWRALVGPRLPPAHTSHSRRSGLAVGAAHRARRTASRRPAGSSRTTR